MYGWRARIGLLVPSCNTVMESEFWKDAPKGVTIHSARVPIKNVTEEELLGMAEDLEEVLPVLNDASVDVIVYGCTSGSFIGGQDYNQELERQLRKACNVPAITTSSAVTAALEKEGIEKVGLVTPYTTEINKREKSYLNEKGFDVVGMKGLGIEDGNEIGSKEPYVVYQLTRELLQNSREIDGVFISCTNFRALEVVPLLSKEIEKPVITSNRASLWYGLKQLGISFTLY